MPKPKKTIANLPERASSALKVLNVALTSSKAEAEAYARAVLKSDKALREHRNKLKQSLIYDYVGLEEERVEQLDEDGNPIPKGLTNLADDQLCRMTKKHIEKLVLILGKKEAGWASRVLQLPRDQQLLEIDEEIKALKELKESGANSAALNKLTEVGEYIAKELSPEKAYHDFIRNL